MKERIKTVQDNYAATVDSINKVDNDGRYQNAINQYNNSIMPELVSLNGAANSDAYNDALSDIVNTLAEMSKGKLARVDGKKPDEFYKESGAQNSGPGTLLVGNENYGSWKQDSSGNSFWKFYGQYAIMSALLGGNNRQHIYYNDWHAHRPYSAYNDGYGSHYSKTYRQNESRLSNRYRVSNSIAAQRYANKYTRTSSVYGKSSQYQKQYNSKPQLTSSSGSNSSVNTTKASSSSTKYSSMYSAPKPKSNYSSYNTTKPKSNYSSYNTTKPKTSYSSYKSSYSRTSFGSRKR